MYTSRLPSTRRRAGGGSFSRALVGVGGSPLPSARVRLRRRRPSRGGVRSIYFIRLGFLLICVHRVLLSRAARPRGSAPSLWHFLHARRYVLTLTPRYPLVSPLHSLLGARPGQNQLTSVYMRMIDLRCPCNVYAYISQRITRTFRCTVSSPSLAIECEVGRRCIELPNRHGSPGRFISAPDERPSENEIRSTLNVKRSEEAQRT